MSLPQGEYQIPQTEYVPSQPEIVEASPVRAAIQNAESLVRGSSFYENRAALLAKEAQERNERQTTIAIGNDIFQQRQAVIDERLNAANGGIMKRVLDIIMPGQQTIGNPKLADEVLRDLTNKESQIGSSLIETPPTVSRQEFFLSDSHPNEWFYHAQSALHPGQSRNIHYLVSEQDGVFKSIDSHPNQAVYGVELTEFTDLTKKYAYLVNKNLYKKD